MDETGLTLKSELKQLISKVKSCKRNFACTRAGFNDVPKGSIINGGELVECYEDRAKNCNHSVPYGSGYYCSCPVRLFIASKLHK
ncbi:MAG: hypothetical protein H8D47_03705 [Planctomycetes bacterium]|nr:hypothetical protein [Planctomycetota bacterium]MBL7106435.1 hypothetical protein [Phycisphaerae bacterium]